MTTSREKLVANLIGAVVALILGILVGDTHQTVSNLDDQLSTIEKFVFSSSACESSSPSIGLISPGDSNGTPASSVRDNSTLLERPSTVTMW